MSVFGEWRAMTAACRSRPPSRPRQNSGKVFRVNDMHRKNFPNLTACFVMAAFLTMFPCLSLADEGIIAHDESSGRYTLDPEKMNEDTWKILVQDDGLQAIVFMPYSDWHISKSQIRALKQLKNIRFINFPRCQNIDIELLQALKTLPKLREVQLGSCQNIILPRFITSCRRWHSWRSCTSMEAPLPMKEWPACVGWAI